MSSPSPLFPVGLRERYEPLRTLGRGGMGAVFLALDRRMSREVAVKVMLPTARDDARKRFEREAEAVARVEHPGVVRVYDYGVVGGAPYLVMEVLEGDSLDRVEDAGEVDLAGVARATAEALDAVHAAGLIHRDVKPANLFRCDDGRVVLTDFGLIVDPTQTQMTKTGAVAGTLAYLPPEAYLSERPEPAWDWWALGASLFRIAEGRSAYRPQDLHAVIQGAPLAPPPFESLEDPSLREAITGLMAKDPASRRAGCDPLRGPPGGAAVEGGSLPGVVSGAVSRLDTDSMAAPGAPSPGARRGIAPWAALTVLGVVGALGAWWLRASPPGLPAPAPSPGAGAWSYPFPEDLGDRVREELRRAEGLYVGQRIDMVGADPGPGWRPLLDPDPRSAWAVISELPSLQRALEWRRDTPRKELAPEVARRLAEVDELMAGQLLWPPFAVSLASRPAPDRATSWGGVLSDPGMMAEEAPPGPWLTRAIRAFDEADEVVRDRVEAYRAVVGGEAPPETFPRAVPLGRLFLLRHPEFLRTSSQRPGGRSAVEEWMAPAPQRIEEAIWALGRAADAGRESAALKLAVFRLESVETYASTRVMVIPPDILLGRRASTPEGRMLELEVGRNSATSRTRYGIPWRLEQELEVLAELRDQLPVGDWRSRLTFLLEADFRGAADRHDEALAIVGRSLREVLAEPAPKWLSLRALMVVRGCLEESKDDSLWDEELIRLADRRLQALGEEPALWITRIRKDVGEAVARRRARDPGFTYVWSFE